MDPIDFFGGLQVNLCAKSWRRGGRASREIAIHYGQSWSMRNLLAQPSPARQHKPLDALCIHNTSRGVSFTRRRGSIAGRARKNHWAVLIPLKDLAFNYRNGAYPRRRWWWRWWWSLPHRDRKQIPTDHIEARWDISGDEIKTRGASRTEQKSA